MKCLQDFDPRGKRYCSIGIEAAMALSGLASAGGNIFSSLFGSDASEEQAEAIRYAADKASQTALDLDEKARGDVAPFRTMGVDAGKIMMDILSGNRSMDDFLKASSLFRFQSDIGSRDINRQLRARGLYGSGAGVEALTRFENQLVAEEGARTFDRLFNVTGLGSNAAARMATNTVSTGQSVANLQVQAGMNEAQARGDAIRSIGNIGPGIAQPFADTVGNLANYNLYKPILDKLAMTGGGGGGRSLSTFTE
jgi:hypothetical protein